MERLLVELCRFLIDAADVAREMAPMRTPEIAAYDLVCANAADETLRHAIAAWNREVRLEPLRDVASRLRVASVSERAQVTAEPAGRILR